eukprot:CAMPEP_0177217936 /NCGR_PEP_ID=MMETSP0367-20130122/35547_1 /TAXON_ID=447022 ORGANISM="Scrippsiella hangoei-like, Strain SHHI-4" /NCGR_SAMPLE_ID=MMETSP0367 /ASSEMBLY_ACC=CAM_ASM_000362 /LENGTH=73 /DNA_ID=CAMNT_0018667533 /DNA_START=173 /DNA_END=394 /DNA_ORIENTATION=-
MAEECWCCCCCLRGVSCAVAPPRGEEAAGTVALDIEEAYSDIAVGPRGVVCGCTHGATACAAPQDEVRTPAGL